VGLFASLDRQPMSVLRRQFAAAPKLTFHSTGAGVELAVRSKKLVIVGGSESVRKAAASLLGPSAAPSAAKLLEGIDSSTLKKVRKESVYDCERDQRVSLVVIPSVSLLTIPSRLFMIEMLKMRINASCSSRRVDCEPKCHAVAARSHLHGACRLD
jgi:hypothetical protein